MHLLIYTFIAVFFISQPLVLGEDDELLCYAIADIDGKKKLYTKGDIFYSNMDMTKCFRIERIEKGQLILRAVNSDDTFTLKPGEKIPLEGTEIVFDKTIETDENHGDTEGWRH